MTLTRFFTIIYLCLNLISSTALTMEQQEEGPTLAKASQKVKRGPTKRVTREEEETNTTASLKKENGEQPKKIRRKDVQSCSTVEWWTGEDLKHLFAQTNAGTVAPKCTIVSTNYVDWLEPEDLQRLFASNDSKPQATQNAEATDETTVVDTAEAEVQQTETPSQFKQMLSLCWGLVKEKPMTAVRLAATIALPMICSYAQDAVIVTMGEPELLHDMTKRKAEANIRRLEVVTKITVNGVTKLAKFLCLEKESDNEDSNAEDNTDTDEDPLA